jgi:hypothetical protein
MKPVNRFSKWCNNRYRGQYDFIRLEQGLHNVRFEISPDRPDKRQLLGKGKTADIDANPEKYNQNVIYIGKILIKGQLEK